MRTRAVPRFLILPVILLAVAIAAEAQQSGKVYRVGYLASAPAESGLVQQNLSGLREGLAELGYTEGRNVLVERRSAEGEVERLPDVVRQLLALKPDALLVETTPGTKAAMEATRDTPIVFIYVSDPVGSGFVESLAQPGRNATGVTNVLPELSGKLVELLRELIPGVDTIGVMWNPANPGKQLEFQRLSRAASTLGVELHPVEVRTAAEVRAAFSEFVRSDVKAVITLAEALTYTNRDEIARLALHHRLLSVFNLTDHVTAGGLLSYSPSYPGMFRRAGVLLGKVLSGVKPAELPVERPTKFHLVINVKTAKALGLTIPPALLLRADRVIE